MKISKKLGFGALGTLVGPEAAGRRERPAVEDWHSAKSEGPEGQHLHDPEVHVFSTEICIF